MKRAFSSEKDETATGGIKVEAVLKWTDATDEQVRSYVNGIRTRGGGTHEAGLKAGVLKAVKNYMETHNLKVKGLSIGP